MRFDVLLKKILKDLKKMGKTVIRDQNLKEIVDVVSSAVSALVPLVAIRCLLGAQAKKAKVKKVVEKSAKKVDVENKK
jgi:hypothetical protein